MERVITYAKVERIVYTFSRYDILDALVEKFNIDLGDYKFNIYEGESDGDEYAKLDIQVDTQIIKEEWENVFI